MNAYQGESMNFVDILRAHPDQAPVDVELLANVVETVYACAQSCTTCADASATDQMAGMLREVINLSLNCADVCITTGRVSSRLTNMRPNLLRSVLETCILACQICAEVCEEHSEHHLQCRVCAEDCRRCEAACRKLLEAMAA